MLTLAVCGGILSFGPGIACVRHIRLRAEISASIFSADEMNIAPKPGYA